MGTFFDPEADFQVHRRNLPHRRQAGVIYFVTFHLADSLPRLKRAALQEERKLWLALNQPPHNERQTEEIIATSPSEFMIGWMPAMAHAL
jgi:hypothetical protein